MYVNNLEKQVKYNKMCGNLWYRVYFENWDFVFYLAKKKKRERESKIRPPAGREGRQGEYRSSSTLSLPSVLDRGGSFIFHSFYDHVALLKYPKIPVDMC
jgi:hypothetical protein